MNHEMVLQKTYETHTRTHTHSMPFTKCIIHTLTGAVGIQMCAKSVSAKTTGRIQVGAETISISQTNPFDIFKPWLFTFCLKAVILSCRIWVMESSLPGSLSPYLSLSPPLSLFLSNSIFLSFKLSVTFSPHPFFCSLTICLSSSSLNHPTSHSSSLASRFPVLIPQRKSVMLCIFRDLQVVFFS